MHVVDLSSLTTAQLAEWQRRYQANLQLYSIDEAAALKGNGGLIAKVASRSITTTPCMPVTPRR
ncbi:hypothetical protein [Rhizobium sp. NZLR4b]|uniref:hypothetical protein n=1 Tax=Rhizobium sp. NZLR4b TaxID=2731102 RepID=UPI001C83ABE1|nr:hypothetical protein [Rhizobium sp. NZLR4b]MBX5164774.1 hypothetical protein [Rhizobium sp. NZLR4b]